MKKMVGGNKSSGVVDGTSTSGISKGGGLIGILDLHSAVDL